jgi:hypothetical protein
MLGTDYDWNVDGLRKPGHSSSGYPVPRPPISVLPSQEYKTPAGLLVTKEDSTKEPKKVMKIVHLADLHIDYDYKIGILTAYVDYPVYNWNSVINSRDIILGTKADCDNEVLCCQEKSGYPEQGKNISGAGLFGDNRKCDAPIEVLYMALNHIKKVHGSEIDIIYMTGDLVPHNIWYSTKADNAATIQGVSRVLDEFFPSAIVVPCLGNHEVRSNFMV